MSRRKCNTAKYRRRREKQRKNRVIRQQREELMKAAPPPPIIPQAIATEDYGEWLRELQKLLRVLRARAGPWTCPTEAH